MFVFYIVCFCGRYLGLKLYGILLYMISIFRFLWCAGFDDDNEDEPDDYHNYYYIDSDNEAVL